MPQSARLTAGGGSNGYLGNAQMNRCKFSLGLPLFGPFWAPLATIGDTSRKDTPPIVSKPQPGCPLTRSMPFQPFGTTRMLKVRFWPFYAIFGHFWTILALFGGSWTKIGETLALPTGSKLQPGCPVTCSTPFQPFWITRVLQKER